MPIHGDGSNWEIYDLRSELDPDLSLSTAWGANSKDVYFVGRNGSIAHYDGKSWKKIESGTEVNLTDVYGNEDGSIVWVCGRDGRTSETVIVEIKNENVSIVLNTYNGNPYSSLWVNGNEVTVVGNRIRRYQYKRKQIETYFAPISEIDGQSFYPGDYTYSVRGKAKNDIFIAGENASLWHYNGSSWYQFESQYGSDRRLKSIDVKDNIVVAVGNEGWPGLILVGHR